MATNALPLYGGFPVGRLALCPPVVYPRLVLKMASKALDFDIDAWLAQPGPVVLNLWSAGTDYTKLITAFRLVHAATPSARLLIVGSASADGNLLAHAASLELSSAVRVIPPQANVAPLLKRAGCVAMANDGRWPSMTRMESSALNIPVVATHDEGATPRIDAWGTLLVRNNAEALAQGIQKALAGYRPQSTRRPNVYSRKAVRAFLAATLNDIPVRRAAIAESATLEASPVSTTDKKPPLWTTHESLLAAAAAASKDRHWPLAANLWQMAVDNFQGGDKALAALCEARRQLADFTNGRRAAETGLRRYPESRRIIVEWALLETDAENWDEALYLWRKAGGGDRFPSRYVHAFAHTCEMMGSWDDQREVITSAVLAQKSDPSLQTRLAFGVAMKKFANGQYEEALRLLRHISTQGTPRYYPFAREFALNSAELQLSLANITDTAARIQKLEAAIRLPRVSGCRIDDLVGLPELLIAQSTQTFNPALQEIARVLQTVVANCGVNPKRIQLMRSTKLQASLQSLAAVLEITDTHSEWMPTGAWLTLSTLTLIAGRFDLYYRCRNHALETEQRFAWAKSRSEKPLSTGDVRRLARVAAESGDKQLFSLLRAQYDQSKEILGFKNCAPIRAAALYFGDRDDLLRWTAYKVSSNDRILKKIIAGRSIAIVGPVDVNIDHGNEIDSFDLIIRFNYRGLGSYNLRRFGSRTDISYYVKSAITKPNYAAFDLAMRELKLINLDSRECRDQHLALFSRIATPVRIRHPIGHTFTNPFLKGTPNGVQRVLFDVMRFQTGRIKVFNTNLWISNDVAADYKHTQKFQFQDLARHDAISNFIFTQQAYTHGLIEADAVLAEVLKMSVDDYVKALQARYGANPRSS